MSPDISICRLGCRITSGLKITDLEQDGLWVIVLVRRQIGNSVGLCGSDNVKNSKSEIYQSKWHVKSENVRWVYFNKDRDSF